MVDTKKVSPEDIETLFATLKKYNGKYDSYIHILNENSETIVSLGKQHRLDICDKLQREADWLLGKGSTQYC
jgi:DNA polymerase-3 subunit alpha